MKSLAFNTPFGKGVAELSIYNTYDDMTGTFHGTNIKFFSMSKSETIDGNRHNELIEQLQKCEILRKIREHAYRFSTDEAFNNELKKDQLKQNFEKTQYVYQFDGMHVIMAENKERDYEKAKQNVVKDAKNFLKEAFIAIDNFNRNTEWQDLNPEIMLGARSIVSGRTGKHLIGGKNDKLYSIK